MLRAVEVSPWVMLGPVGAAKELWDFWQQHYSEPPQPGQAPTPPAPRSAAEMRYWTPADAQLVAQQDWAAAIRAAITGNTAADEAARAGLAARKPPEKENSNTLLWVLGTAAAVGLAVAIFRR